VNRNKLQQCEKKGRMVMPQSKDWSVCACACVYTLKTAIGGLDTYSGGVCAYNE
jgi:hypothetical protein